MVHTPTDKVSVDLDPACTPAEIESRSFAIIDAEIPEPRTFDGPLWQVARRCVHTLGDTDIVDDLRLSAQGLAARGFGEEAHLAPLQASLATGLVQADRYLAAGYEMVVRRWRGKAGEIDMILRKGALFVFVEVKSSRDFAHAAERISRRQMDRICMAACEFCGGLPAGQSTEMRMDAALVDQFGRVEIIEAAFGAH